MIVYNGNYDSLMHKFAPESVEALSFAKGYYENENGKVSVIWKRDGNTITLNVARSGNLNVEIGVCESDKLHINIQG